MKTKKGEILFYLSLILALLFANNVLADQNWYRPPPTKLYSLTLKLGPLHKNATEHIFLISENGKKFKIWNIQKDNKKNIYKISGFKEKINYFLASISRFPNNRFVKSPNIVHFGFVDGKMLMQNITIGKTKSFAPQKKEKPAIQKRKSIKI